MILDAGKEYWTVLGQFHRNRKNPAIVSAAVRTMRRIETGNPAILRRIAAFTARFPQPAPTGPRTA